MGYASGEERAEAKAQEVDGLGGEGHPVYLPLTEVHMLEETEIDILEHTLERLPDAGLSTQCIGALCVETADH